ncbi:hypothetical protein AArcSl_0182 [Halalkaliarchaeum desulfuricum]|uniref:Uncharacterized protein n=1 Tax=Halalkaliarchaeum desulfuricum TaxID=2055893 RepID=A0A343TFG5_9EURY|nr:LiaF domain-containing protein [Halalkaliarchaeum desulfuricum]AUX07837.1 hypothetical protein AArcSl_0182 [Halalkaliarchaeum desulfuricum]
MSTVSSTIRSQRLPTGRFLLGALVILVGVLLLFQTTGVFETRQLLQYVPSLFVLLGIWLFVQSGFRSLVGPVVIVGVAGAVQLIVLGYATAEQLVVYWPVLVIALGLSIAMGQYRSSVRRSDASYSSGVTVFGGVEKRNTSEAFVGGDLTTIFGETTLDLRDAQLTDRPARVDLTVLFGEAQVIVPRDWVVQMEVIPILGSAADDRPRRAIGDDMTVELEGATVDRDGVDLVVTGFVAFGEASVRD